MLPVYSYTESSERSDGVMDLTCGNVIGLRAVLVVLVSLSLFPKLFSGEDQVESRKGKVFFQTIKSTMYKVEVLESPRKKIRVDASRVTFTFPKEVLSSIKDPNLQSLCRSVKWISIGSKKGGAIVASGRTSHAVNGIEYGVSIEVMKEVALVDGSCAVMEVKFRRGGLEAGSFVLTLFKREVATKELNDFGDKEFIAELVWIRQPGKALGI